MANGTIAFDTLSTSGQISGTAKSVDTDYLVSGSLKAWRKYTCVTTTASTDSFNFSSIQDNATGDTDHTMTNAMANTTYTIIHDTQFSTFNGHYSGGTLNTDGFRTGVYNSSSVAVDVEHNFVHVAGDLA